MPCLDRRTFVTTLAAAGIAPLAARPAAQATRVPDTPADVTRRLARYVVGHGPTTSPRRCARSSAHGRQLGRLRARRRASRDARHAIAALAPFSGPAQATVLGRRERMDALTASLMNGMSSHVLDFDDTHLKTVIHPAGPVAPAILALAESGRCPAATSCTRSSSAPKWNAGSATRSIPRTTTAAGTSPARPASSAPPRRAASCLGSANNRWCGRWDWRRRSRSACARCSDR